MDSCPADNSVLSTTSELVSGLIIRRRYEILEKIGVGGMAAVYRARHIAFNEIRAIKVVRGWLTEDEDFVRRLRSEAMISRKLNHPNAVHVDDLDELEDGRPFIVMEYVQGLNLRSVIRDTGPLSPSRALNIARQVASALGAAHELHIIHRDIKPDNIVLVQNNGREEVKVMDFGIAKMRGGTGNFETRAGVVLCTPEYASPEQASGKKAEELDGRSDLYSLGIVLYEMLTGTLPFRSDTPIGMLLAQIGTAPRLPSEANPDLNLPEPVSQLLMKSLEKDSEKRFQNASEMLQAIDKVEAELAATRADNVVSMPLLHTDALVPEEGRSSEELLSELHDGGRKRVWMGVAAIALLLLVSFGVWSWKKMQQSSARRDALTHRVQQTVASDPAATKMQATVSDGVVMLSGDANNNAAVEELASRLASLEGVYRVDKHNVRVISTPTPPAAKPSPPSTVAGNKTSPPASAPEVLKPNPESKPAVSQESATRTVPRPDPRVADLLARAKQEHDEGLYDDEIRDYDEVLKLDRGNGEALRGKRKAIRAKQVDPGSQL